MIGKLIGGVLAFGAVGLGGWLLAMSVGEGYCGGRTAEYEESLDTLAQYEVDMRAELARRGVAEGELPAATRVARTRCPAIDDGDPLYTSLVCDVQREVAPDLGDVRERERRLVRELTICLPGHD